MRRVLVANRGEIACRVIRAARTLGLETVAVYSEADRDAPHVAAADLALEIGPAPVPKSYANAEALLEALRRSGADAVHPGYGLLSENAGFAQAVTEAGAIWVGPTPEAIRRMGDKVEALAAARAAGVPVAPGSHGTVAAAEAAAVAERVGYPVMLKAAAGGGGIGIARLGSSAELEKAIEGIRTRARNFFGNDAVYVEKFIERPRHIEIQVFADHHGQVIHLGERECSLQRRHQKVLEESPSPVVDAALRERMGEAAVALARAIGYRNAGTLEFLLGADGEFHFMEMNTRIQVEHPVTELVQGVDLVAEQLRVAAGERLSIARREPLGHAIEVRLCAEDPTTLFPAPGRIDKLVWPSGEGIRIDTGVVEGSVISPYYDSLLAKLVVCGADRTQAIERLGAALAATRIEGLKTNLPVLARIAADPEFRAGRFDTGFLREQLGIRTA
jgi:acetyl-CoA carboxylase biotin carboxylase subunit